MSSSAFCYHEVHFAGDTQACRAASRRGLKQATANVPATAIHDNAQTLKAGCARDAVREGLPPIGGKPATQPGQQ